jgi:hypothetical protein
MRLLRLLYTVPLRFRSLFRRDHVERDLEESSATTLNGESMPVSRKA